MPINLPEITPVNTVVYTMVANDIDANANAKIVYSFSPPCPSFAIDSENGKINLTARLDHEITKSQTCIVKATDGGEPQLSGTNVCSNKDHRY